MLPNGIFYQNTNFRLNFLDLTSNILKTNIYESINQQTVQLSWTGSRI